MCVRCGTGRIAWCTDPHRHGESTEAVSPGDPPVLDTAPAPGGTRECCGLPMSTLDVFGVRLYRCMHRSHHPLIFRNLNTGEELTESYSDGDSGLEWTSHYAEG
jgi:hypothetical protein